MKPPFPGPSSHAVALRAALALVSTFGVGCSGSSNTDGGQEPAFDAGIAGCAVQFSGNYTDNQTFDGGCGGLTEVDGGSSDGGADWQLVLVANSAVAQAPTTVTVDLGSNPTPGTFNANTVVSWSAVAINAASMCEYSAGNLSVPTGTFTLTLTSIGSLSGGAGEVTVHGALEVEQYVQQPPGSDCGANDTETVAFEF